MIIIDSIVIGLWVMIGITTFINIQTNRNSMKKKVLTWLRFTNGATLEEVKKMVELNLKNKKVVDKVAMGKKG